MCDCIDTINAALHENNARLDIPYLVDTRTGQQILPLRMQVKCYKLDLGKRGTIPCLPATFCPFCGEKYVAEAEVLDAPVVARWSVAR